jgi:predicted NBD/HSP70 family sugar kinase
MKGNSNVNQQRMAEPTSESTIGLDLGDRWSRYCVIDSRGSVVKEDRVRTSPEALEETFRVVLPSKIAEDSAASFLSTVTVQAIAPASNCIQFKELRRFADW